MPKRLFRKYLPSPDALKRRPALRLLGVLLSDPNLWHINRHSLAGAAFIGIFCALIPIPLQMIVAVFLAVKFRCNLPLSVVLVWFTNPFTIVPVFYFTYRVGAWLLGMPVTPPDQVSFHWLIEQMIPLWVGSIFSGLVAGGLAWISIKLVWRLAVQRSWDRRRLQRLSDGPSRSSDQAGSDSPGSDADDDNRPS